MNTILSLFVPITSINKVFAFQHRTPPSQLGKDTPRISRESWRHFNLLEEYTKMGIFASRNNQWRLTKENLRFGLCDTYPMLLCVPANISDDSLHKIANYRCKHRFPVLSFQHENGRTVCRSGQPLTGLFGKENPDDLEMLSTIASLSVRPSWSGSDPNDSPITQSSTTPIRSPSSRSHDEISSSYRTQTIWGEQTTPPDSSMIAKAYLSNWTEFKAVVRSEQPADALADYQSFFETKPVVFSSQSSIFPHTPSHGRPDSPPLPLFTTHPYPGRPSSPQSPIISSSLPNISHLKDAINDPLMMPPHDSGLQNCGLSPHAQSGPIFSSRIPYFSFNSSPSSDTKTLESHSVSPSLDVSDSEEEDISPSFPSREPQDDSIGSELSSDWQIVSHLGLQPSSPSSSPIPLPSLRSPTGLGGEKGAGQVLKSLLIVDARPKIAAVGNKFMKGGYEDKKRVSNFADVAFLGIQNIHKVRESLQALIKSLEDAIRIRKKEEPKKEEEKKEERREEAANDEGSRKRVNDSIRADYEIIIDDPTQSLLASSWYHHLAMILHSASSLSSLLSSTSLLIHCSDGWDRTPQLCSLISIFVNPRHRTLAGFIGLLEKDWFLFGHRFADRTGSTPAFFTSQKMQKQLSPTFVQFLDCCYQLVTQFPDQFEFGSGFLDFVFFHLTSGRFGNFLWNNQKECEEARAYEKTRSLWDEVEERRKRGEWVNSEYSREKALPLLIPSITNFSIWPIFFPLVTRFLDLSLPPSFYSITLDSQSPVPRDCDERHEGIKHSDSKLVFNQKDQTKKEDKSEPVRFPIGPSNEQMIRGGRPRGNDVLTDRGSIEKVIMPFEDYLKQATQED
ncbi:putative Phosphoinositide 3-phosphatase [Blattamonas nauphoetae]|uniref:Phosphoinositide 3-phosphatase n=1 Tax=Blattamonas nauphoetae TaxID=2049346 RepID=A0ABQ9XR54_9EUKA|nr:putative Phosphoinositide 3-phosphatase [Blattamonas nauphoetae]